MVRWKRPKEPMEETSGNQSWELLPIIGVNFKYSEDHTNTIPKG